MVDKRPYYVVVASLAVFGGNFYWLRYIWTDQCPLFRIERCLLLGGSKCIVSMVNQSGASEPSTVQRLSAFQRVHY